MRGLVLFPFLASAFAANPPLTYQAIFGSTQVAASAVDQAGNVYLAGSTTSASFPVTPNAFQKNFTPAVCGYIPGPHGTAGPPIPCNHGFVAKVDASGTRLLYATYLGGDSQDSVAAISIDSNGSAYVTGYTASSNFPVTPGAYLTSGSGFVTKLNADGSGAVFSTRLPGQGSAVAVDSGGNAYVAGIANGADFPTTPGAFQSKRYVGHEDVFVIKLTPDGAKARYSTLIGGTFTDTARAIAVDASGNAYIAGFTGSTPDFADFAGAAYALFPATPGAYSHTGHGADVFITKLNPDGSGLVFSSVFGGSGDDQINALAVDDSGSAYFAGATPYSPDFPITQGAFQKTYGGGFAGKLSADGSQLVYSTYLGTGRGDSVSQIKTDTAGHAFVSGRVYRANFPTTPNADRVCFAPTPYTGFQPTPFYAELNPAGSELLYATFANTVVALDSAGRFYSSSGTQILQRIDSSTPVPASIRCVANAANGRQGPLAPGEIVSLFGPGIGPDEPASARPDASGKMPTTLSNTSVLINGAAAPLLYVSKNQINAVVPFAVGAAAQATVHIERQWFDLAPVSVAVADAAPGAFTLDGSGYGQIAALNEDGTINSPENPAAQGSIVALYLTGFGQMQPVPMDGAIAEGPSSKPVLRPVVRVGDSLDSVDVPYCGDAPGLVEGAIQMNVRIPQLFQTGQVPVNVQVGDASLANVPLLTISVK
ncbi:MAG: SBBP repeat-containing protein [Bryobacteraceae bacterium]